MPNTLSLIQTVTLTSNNSTVQFSLVPQTYDDLYITALARTNRPADVGDNMVVRFNGDATANYATRRFFGTGSSASGDYAPLSSGLNWGAVNSTTSTANIFGVGTMYIPNYRSNTTKTTRSEAFQENNDSTTKFFAQNSGLWSGTTAITSITITPQVGTLFLANTTFSLYGVLNT